MQRAWLEGVVCKFGSVNGGGSLSTVGICHCNCTMYTYECVLCVCARVTVVHCSASQVSSILDDIEDHTLTGSGSGSGSDSSWLSRPAAASANQVCL